MSQEEDHDFKRYWNNNFYKILDIITKRKKKKFLYFKLHDCHVFVFTDIQNNFIQNIYVYDTEVSRRLIFFFLNDKLF